MTKKKCLLINPPIKLKDPPYNMPLGLTCIAAVIEDEGHDVAIFDNNAYKLTHEQLLGEIQGESWDIIGIGNILTTYTWQKKMFKLLKHEFPNSLLIIGGGLPSSLQDEAMSLIPEVDILCIGEGERTISQILKNHDTKNWDDVRGILYRKKDKIVRTPPQKLLSEEELSKLPHPKYDLLPLDIYFKYSSVPQCPEAMLSKRRIQMESSRGCPFRCTFCIDLSTGTPRNLSHSDRASLYVDSLPESIKVRYYDPKWVVDLMRELRIKYCIDFVNFVGENYTVNKKSVIEFCDLLEKEGLTDLDPPLHWSVAAHVNTIDREMLQRMKDTGCSYLDLGFESMNADVLSKGIVKGATPEKNEWGFRQCIDIGIYPLTNFMIGLPNESIQSVYDTTKFLVENKIECGPFFVTPYPKTGLFEEYKDKIIEKFGSVENYVIKCENDISMDFIVNLTKYNDAELLGLRQMIMNHDLEQIKKFAEYKGEQIVDNKNIIVAPISIQGNNSKNVETKNQIGVKV